MKRAFTVAALAALAAGPALAQSDVTVYGRVNLTVESQDANGVKTQVMNDNSSRLGFKGSEDLGDGLRAGFQLEHGFSADTGQPATAFWGRQSEVNVSGKFGMVRLGNFRSEAYYAIAESVSLHNHNTGTSADGLYAELGSKTNKVAWRLPEFAKGLSIEAAATASEGVLGAVHTYDVAVDYNAGPMHVGFGYQKGGSSTVSATQYAISGLYRMGEFIFGGYWQRDENAFGPGTRDNFRGSVAYITGPHEFHLNGGKASEYSNLANSGAAQMTAAYNYNLSKRTKLYGYYTQVNAEAATPYLKDFSSLALGMRHNF